jgi:multicomponent Na+:H+ antiporter subunit E
VRIALRPWRVLVFLVLYLWDLILANAIVAWEIMTPNHQMSPGIVACPTRSRSDMEVMMLANLISFTPGTLTLEVSEDRSMIYVHALHISTPDGIRERVRRLEDRLLWVVR